MGDVWATVDGVLTSLPPITMGYFLPNSDLTCSRALSYLSWNWPSAFSVMNLRTVCSFSNIYNQYGGRTLKIMSGRTLQSWVDFACPFDSGES
jgi:hypothetical protein